MFTYMYLHGFASGPLSSKARFFAARCADGGITLEVPELDEGKFEETTVARQLAAIERSAAGRPLRLIGSSLGGWLAALYAARHPEVDRVVLLAPAFGFVSLFAEMLGPDKMDRWDQEGVTAVFHYGSGGEKWLRFGFYADARRFEPFPVFTQPGLILHGIRDETVPVNNSVRFATSNPNARLVTLESGHELTDVTDRLWREASGFFGWNGGRQL